MTTVTVDQAFTLLIAIIGVWSHVFMMFARTSDIWFTREESLWAWVASTVAGCIATMAVFNAVNDAKEMTYGVLVFSVCVAGLCFTHIVADNEVVRRRLRH